MEIPPAEAIKGRTARIALVEAVRDSPAHTPENDWVEWKSTADLTKRNWQDEVAKQILGMANRAPAVAGREAGGHGYVLMGVSPGQLRGVTPADPADIDNRIAPILGPTPPLFELYYETLGDKRVLVVAVEPTRSGSRPFLAHKDATGFGSGDILIRSGTRTRPATAPEVMEMLAERTASDPLTLAVATTAGVGALPVLDPVQNQLGLITQTLETAIRRTMSTNPQLYAAQEKRSSQQFLDEVAAYGRAVRDALPEYLASRLTRAGHGRVELVVWNDGPRHFSDVLLRLRVPGTYYIAFESFHPFSELPSPPSEWARSPARDWLASFAPPVGVAVERPRIDHEGSEWVVRFPLFDIHPSEREYVAPLYLVAPPDAAGHGVEFS